MSKQRLTGLASIIIVLVIAGAGAVVLLSGDDPTGQEPDQDAATEDAQDDRERPADEPADPEPAVETVAEGFNQPWGLAFLPDGEQLLVTQLSGVLTLVDTGTGQTTEIHGISKVDTAGQGGLLDVAVHPDFPDSEWIYLTYSATNDTGATATHLARGRLDQAEQRLTDVEVLYVATPFRQGGAHYGSKITFGSDGHLFMTIGDRGDKSFGDHPSQDTSHAHGTTIRLAPDGAIPADNPFVDDPEVVDEIYSYGHRNAQGITLHPETGDIWLSEHGEQGGDAIHILEAGGNHGWPQAHTGCEYGTDTPIGDHPGDRDDIIDPIHYWECQTGGFPPAGMTFYSGAEFPTWEGDLLLGGLASQYLARFTVDGRTVEEADPLLADEGWRIRDVAVGPLDGAIYVAIDADDVPLVRLVNTVES